MYAHEMMETHPQNSGRIDPVLSRLVEACLGCTQACTACADACLGEEMVARLTQCIRFNLDCADVCAATAAVASRRTGRNEGVICAMLGACAEACRLCGDECGRHGAHMEHCRICAQACRDCERACRDALQGIGLSLQ